MKNRKNRKSICLSAIVIAIVGLTACGKEEKTQTPTATATQPSATTQPQTATTKAIETVSEQPKGDVNVPLEQYISSIDAEKVFWTSIALDVSPPSIKEILKDYNRIEYIQVDNDPFKLNDYVARNTPVVEKAIADAKSASKYWKVQMDIPHSSKVGVYNFETKSFFTGLDNKYGLWLSQTGITAVPQITFMVDENKFNSFSVPDEGQARHIQNLFSTKSNNLKMNVYGYVFEGFFKKGYSGSEVTLQVMALELIDSTSNTQLSLIK